MCNKDATQWGGGLIIFCVGVVALFFFKRGKMSALSHQRLAVVPRKALVLHRLTPSAFRDLWRLHPASFMSFHKPAFLSTDQSQNKPRPNFGRGKFL